MFETELKLYELMRQWCHRMAADIDPAQLAHQPAPGIKPPIWVLGHLAVSTDYAARILGLARDCPRPWHVHFGRGSQTVPPDDVRPAKDELLAALDGGHRRVAAAIATADAGALGQPHQVELFQGTPLATLGDLVGHLLTTHEAFHLGQLSTWRRQMGYLPMF